MIVAFVPDLMMRSKVDVAARHYGAEVRHVATAAGFREALGSAPALVLIDLDAEAGDMVDFVRQAKEARAARVLAFCSHVRTELIARAREAGADAVMPNSAFAAGIAGEVRAVIKSRTGEEESPGRFGDTEKKG